MATKQNVISVLFVAGLAIGLSACEQSVAGSCSTAQDVAGKLTTLVDDLNLAHGAGRLDMLNAGDIGANILEAGANFSKSRNNQAYCGALEKIRLDARLK